MLSHVSLGSRTEFSLAVSNTRVIADQVLVAEGLRHVLKQSFAVLGIASTAAQVKTLCSSQQAEILLINPAVFRHAELTELLTGKYQTPGMKLIFVSDRADRLSLGRAIQAGASGFVLKEQRPEELCDAIRIVAKGRTYVPPQHEEDLPWARALRPVKGGDRASNLTSRQWEVLRLVAEGRASKEIGALLQISVKTVEFHRACLMSAVGVHTVAELSRFAMHHGIVGPVL